MPKSDIQNPFSMSKISRIHLIFLIENYKIGSTTFINDIFLIEVIFQVLYFVKFLMVCVSKSNKKNTYLFFSKNLLPFNPCPENSTTKVMLDSSLV